MPYLENVLIIQLILKKTMKYLILALTLSALLTGCGPQDEAATPEKPEEASADSKVESAEPDTGLALLSALLKKGGAEGAKLSPDEKRKVEELLGLILPGEDAVGGDKVWEVNYHDGEGNDFFQVDLNAEAGERLIWFHILYKQEKPSIYGSEDFGKYRGMGHEDAHYFILVGNVEIRAVASADSYKDTEKIKDILKVFKLEDVEKL